MDIFYSIMANFFQMFNQMRNLKNNFKEMQEKLVETQIEGKSDDNSVLVRINGLKEILEIRIDESLLNTDSKEIIENTIKKTINDTMKSIEEVIKDNMQIPNILNQ